MPKGTQQAKDQRAKFVEKARELACDEDEANFEAKLKKIANAQLPKQPAKKSKKRT